MCLTCPSPLQGERDPIREMYREARWYLEHSPKITLEDLKAHLKERRCPFLPEKLRQIAQEGLARYLEEGEGAANQKKVCEKILEVIPA